MDIQRCGLWRETHNTVSTNKFVVADSYIVCRIKADFVFLWFTNFLSKKREQCSSEVVWYMAA